MLLASSAILIGVGSGVAAASAPVVALLGLGGVVTAAMCVYSSWSLAADVALWLVKGGGPAELESLAATGSGSSASSSIEASVALDLDRDGVFSADDVQRWMGRGW